MGKHCPVLQITGYQGSGKTTFIDNLIHLFRERGMKTAVLKHHGHGGVPESRLAHKDSTLHKEAGAYLSGVEGSGVMQVESTEEIPLSKLLEFYQLFGPDIILIEGYKRGPYPKIVMLRKGDDESLLKESNHVLCAVSPVSISEEWGFPCFSTQDKQRCLDFILEEVEGQNDNQSF